MGFSWSLGGRSEDGGGEDRILAGTLPLWSYGANCSRWLRQLVVENIGTRLEQSRLLGVAIFLGRHGGALMLDVHFFENVIR